MIRVFWLILLLPLSIWAQDCGNNFQDINSGCIEKYSSKFKANTITLSKIKDNDVYFYQTDNGHLGKVMFKYQEAKDHSCSVYFEGTTFQANGNYNPQQSLTIKNKLGIWGSREINLDYNGGVSDLKFYRLISNDGKKDPRCLIEPTGATWVKYRNLTEATYPSDFADWLIFYAGIFIFAFAAFLIARSFFEEEDRFRAEEKMEDGSSQEEIRLDFVLKYSRPFFKRYFSPVVSSMKGKSKIRDKYKRPIASAGLQKVITPDDFYAFKLFLILGFPIVFLGVRTFLEETWSLGYIPVVSVIGFYYPDIWIKGTIQRRQEEIIQNMPFIVDMLALSVEAGLDFVAAMAKVVDKAPKSALSDEFDLLIREIKIGSSRAEALRQLSWRVNILSVSSFCATLIAADSVGTPIGPILKKLSQELREKRSAIAEKKGATAATKILIPMIFFVLPAVILVIFAPMIFQFMAGG